MTAENQLDLPIYTPSGKYLFTCEGLTVNPHFLPGEALAFDAPLQGTQISLYGLHKRIQINVAFLPTSPHQAFGIVQDAVFAQELLTSFQIIEDPEMIECVRKRYGSPTTGFRFRVTSR
ncbi:hypothetical protein OIV19_21710 [Brucella sp. HL-2]|nr:hypothetical protein [Brucella sp. HL-2]MCV9910214.1 hypothetical protein [Brucella sp. HL-2]